MVYAEPEKLYDPSKQNEFDGTSNNFNGLAIHGG